MPQESIPSTSDRLSNGWFAKGNKISIGNVAHQKMHALRTAALKAETPERVAAVLDAMHQEALNGDSAAAKVYLDHTVGRPAQAVQISGPDGAPLGVTLAHLQVAVLGALGDADADVRARVAQALRAVALEAKKDTKKVGVDAHGES